MKRASRGDGSFRKCTDHLAWVAAQCLALGLVCGQPAYAQEPASPTPPSSQGTVNAEPGAQAAALEFFNRPIVTLRARVLGRQPAERAAGAIRTLDELVNARAISPVEARPVSGALLITVAGRGVVAITPPDVDELSGQTVQQAADEAMSRLRQALAEAEEARTPDRLLRSGSLAVLGLAVGLLLIFALGRVRRRAARRLDALLEASISKTGIVDAQFVHGSRLLVFQRRLVWLATVVLQLILGYATITFVLRRFPFTRPWGESMRSFLIRKVADLALGFAEAMPGLVTIALILVLTRCVVKLIEFWFSSVEQGKTPLPKWLHPETVPPTRRLVTAFAWLFALVLVYPYVPGSQTDAFKGVSVLLGLMLTLGSSGIVTQAMSSFMITYSRALRVGDYVRIGNVEGTVSFIGMLSTKIRTPYREEITIPNALVISQTTTDYSRFADGDGVFTPTSVTIGYDAPWRQVHELLILAASRTPGIRREPKPFVLQTALEDFYVKYTLLACFERQDARGTTRASLHANIQDSFNEYGVQIMSPHYESDPTSPKIVPKAHWFTAPAAAAPSAAPKPARARDSA